MEAKSQEDKASFYFCRYDDEGSLRARTIIGTIAKQLVKDIPPDEFSDLEGDELELSVIISFLTRKLSRTCKHYLIIDGLDECNEFEITEVFGMLYKLHISSIHFNIFCSGRPALLTELPLCFKPDRTINMEEPQIHQKIAHDISYCIESKLKEIDEKMKIDPEVESIILQKLHEGAEGMFLWVKLQLLALHRAKSNGQLLTALKTLPRNLPEIYERILKQIDPDDSNRAIRIFHWIIAAKRPLSVDELREAVAIKPLAQAVDTDQLIQNMEQGISCCGSLILVNEETGTVHFIHSSVKHYLLSQDVRESVQTYYVSLPDTNEELGLACVTYLSFARGALARQMQSTGSFERIPYFTIERTSPFGKHTRKLVAHQARRHLQSIEKTKRVLEEAVGDTEDHRKEVEFKENALRPYAEEFWLEHTKRRIDPKSSRAMWGLWCDLVDLTGWIDKCVGVSWSEYEWKTRSNSVLSWIKAQDHCSLAQYLILFKPTLSDDQLAILLHGAAANGNHDLIDLYLNSRNEIPNYVLEGGVFEACKSGLLTTVDYLLAAGADAAGNSSSYCKPIKGAIEGGSVNVIQRLLKEGLDVNVQDNVIPHRTPLQAAAEGGHLEIAEILLESGADINAPASSYDSGRTALQAAAGGGHSLVVVSLLRHGADANAPPGKSNGRTALQAAAEIGHLGIMSRLMNSQSPSGDRKTIVNGPAGESRGCTALRAAAGNGHESAVAYLIAEGADINANACGKTALQAAAEKGHLTVVDMLCTAESKANVNAPAAHETGRTALQAAAGGGHLHVIDRLLLEGAECNASPGDIGGRTALQAAAEHGYIEIVKRLVQEGAEINAPPSPSDGLTALQAAAKSGELDLIDFLLSSECDADVNAPACDEDGRTALQAASGSGHLESVRQLLQHGADIDAPAAEVNGRTALQAAAGSGFLTIVRHLLQKGANVNAIGSQRKGRTAIQAAAEGGHEKVVKELLQAKALVNTHLQDLGTTALRAAAEGGFLNVVRVLLEAGATDAAEKETVLGMTARYAAMLGGHAAVEKCLEEAGFHE